MKRKTYICNECLYKYKYPLLNSFLEGCTSVNVNKKTNEKKVNAFVHSIEQVMYTRNLNIITPFSFIRNLYYIVSQIVLLPLTQTGD